MTSTGWMRGALIALALWALGAAPAAAQVVADAGEDLLLECAGAEGSAAMLDGLGSTVDGLAAVANPDASFLWEAVGIVFDDASAATPLADFPVGTTTVTLTLTRTDPVTAVETSSQDMVDVVVGDTTPPILSILADPMYLWPPNHKLHEIEVDLEVMDACDPNPTVVLLSAVSNEPDNGIGDGDTVNDIQEADVGTDDRTFLARAERAGPGSGRIYALTYEAGDASGNTTQGAVQILVPHDQGDVKAAKAAEKAAKKAAKAAEKAAKDAAKAAEKAAKAAQKAAAKAVKEAAKAAKKAAKDAAKAAKAAAKAAGS